MSLRRCCCAGAPPRPGSYLHSPPRPFDFFLPPLPLSPLPIKPTRVFQGFKPHRSLPRRQAQKTPGAGSLHSTLRALESEPIEDLDDEALDSLVGDLSPKELTVVLKRQRDWRRALRVFRRIRSRKDYLANPIHYNIVLRTLGRARRWDELRLCWIDMAKDGVLPTNNTYATLIDAYGKAGLVKEALLWLKHMKARGISPDEVSMNTVVRILKDSRQFDQGERFFRGWCDGRVELDCLDIDFNESDSISPKHFLLTELFKSGGRAPVSSVAVALKEGPRKPRLAATYNTLIDLYGKAGRLKDASDAFAEMLRSGISPDTITFNTMINICGSHGHLREAESLLDKMEERRVLPDTKTFNIFMSMYASVGNTEVVLTYYNKIREMGLCQDIVSHRIILQLLCERKMVQEVENVIDEMMELGAHVDEQSLPVVMKMYIDERLLDKANIFFEKHCSGGGISSKNYAAIMDAYADKGLWKEAEDVFFGKRNIGFKRDVVEYNVMIKAYGRAKLYDKALSVFEHMRSCGTWPDECTYNSLIQMLVSGDLLERARELLARMREVGFKPRCETFSAVIAGYSRKSLISEAIEVYHLMKTSGVEPNEIVYGSLIDAFAEAGKVDEALHCYNLMEESGLNVNQIVLTSVIKAYSTIGYWREAQKLYAKMKNMKGGPDIIASNCMINLYAGLGMVSEAKLIFDDLIRNGQADGVSYATMMYLYKSMGMLDEANDVAQAVQKSGLLTDPASYNSVMASYLVNGKLRECAELLHQMLAQRILPDASTFKTLFTVLKKGGIPSEAVSQLESSYNEGRPYARQAIITSLFSVVGLHAFALEYCDAFVSAEVALDSFAYNVAIYAYSASGQVDKALNLFMRMQDDALKPDLVTFIYLAGCYGKAGMVEGLRRIYGLLKYGEIEPNESLYKALIDAYEDAGKHDLAEMVDQEMRFSIHTEKSDKSENEND
ncbi:pentatricopeptide repeat-containing protein At1g73710 [Elaeis guineensis]|uniref:Pentatricopeptide repeat-containing protein At1g73710 n=1 Tax=Elaeis guineensis var. tenera TaxID=51953 RepID=A0A6I9QHX4_ELAGV|nr:pentatricopeptide repeat-containing protein At1g73710 [Elaeis guineensis]